MSDILQSSDISMDDLLDLAVRENASDLHLAVGLPPVMRISGSLVPIDASPLTPADTERLMLAITPEEHQRGLREHCGADFGFPYKDLARFRVSIFRQKGHIGLVLRQIPSKMLTLEQIGLPAQIRDLLFKPRGLILVTGPIGSGKTTTLYSALYACLNTINKPDRKIITVEDPVEYQMSGINQVQVRADIGMTFAAALRAILRQAPNIIMIGEIRDLETAEIAINASLTGHLVFSTLHTNDAPGAVTRLIDMGVKPFLVASSTRAIMAQRLVRKICEKCKEPYTPPESELRLLGPAAQQLANATIYHGAGCADCKGTGYRGRIGIFEIFLIDDQVRNLIFDQVPATELRIKARELGMRTLREDGLRKVAAGLTTLSEVLRVTMGDSN